MPKGIRGFTKGYTPYNKGGTSWNKGVPTKHPRCEECGVFLRKDGTHICKSVDLKGDRFCIECGSLLRNNTKERYGEICMSCSRKGQRKLERILRAQLKTQFGGKCQNCGYDRYQQCLEFHHINNADKNGKHFLKEIIRNPGNFQLLCNRCHREWHIENNGGQNENQR